MLHFTYLLFIVHYRGALKSVCKRETEAAGHCLVLCDCQTCCIEKAQMINHKKGEASYLFLVRILIRV